MAFATTLKLDVSFVVEGKHRIFQWCCFISAVAGQDPGGRATLLRADLHIKPDKTGVSTETQEVYFYIQLNGGLMLPVTKFWEAAPLQTKMQ